MSCQNEVGLNKVLFIQIHVYIQVEFVDINNKPKAYIKAYILNNS